jgi:hypothetical protein
MDIGRRKDILATVYLLGIIAAIAALFWIVLFASVTIKKIFIFTLLITMVSGVIFIIWKLIRSLIE